MKHLSILIFQLFSLELITSQACDTITPVNPETCSDLKTGNNDCCYVEITDKNERKFPFCVEVKSDYRFALDFIERISYNQFENELAKFNCEQTKKTCGVSEPEELFQCRKHSSTSKSCCKMTNKDGHAECILSNKKFENKTTTHEMFGMTIECSSSVIQLGLLVRVLLTVISMTTMI